MAQNEEATIEKFKKMVLEERDIVPCTDNDFLVRFLRARNWDIYKALQLLLNYYQMRVDHEDIYKNFSPSAPIVRRVHAQNFGMFLPERDDRGRVVYFTREDKWDASLIPLNERYLDYHMRFEFAITDVETQKNGFVLIHDVSNIGIHHVKQLAPANFKKIIHFIEEGFPGIFAEIHVVNVNPVFKTIFTLLKPIMSKELRDKIFLHSNYEEMFKQVNPKIIPQEYGGNALYTLDNTEEVKRFLEREDELLKLSNYGYKSVLAARDG